jgi:heme ABC exporter ATP-binding subunit CcmA
VISAAHPEEAPVVELVGVVTVLDRFPALSGLDLQVVLGEAVLLRGPNGAGKTTVLKVCAGLAAVATGTARVLGLDLRADRRAVRRDVAMLGHAGFLYDDLTIAESVRFAVRAAGGEVARVAPALTRLGLDGRLARLRVGACSAGQRRRTALAVIVARQPKLWLLDEPHAALDAGGRDLLDAVVREAVDSGATVLLASHDEDRAAALASRTVTVVGGHVVSDEGRSLRHRNMPESDGTLRGDRREGGHVA